ncbi:MAG: hypothetical protein OXP12_00160 [Thaumarchaeota archaeon]|nr:hypothetical protein [Nitrososphaerota archaeon]
MRAASDFVTSPSRHLRTCTEYAHSNSTSVTCSVFLYLCFFARYVP